MKARCGWPQSIARLHISLVFHTNPQEKPPGDTGCIFAHGGQNGKAILSLSGEACSLIGDWERLATVMREHFEARITRWYAAVDDYLGDRPVHLAVDLCRAFLFGV
jgi:hypothetical protein